MDVDVVAALYPITITSIVHKRRVRLTSKVYIIILCVHAAAAVDSRVKYGYKIINFEKYFISLQLSSNNCDRVTIVLYI
jgi:hypothetical protein